MEKGKVEVSVLSTGDITVTHNDVKIIFKNCNLEVSVVDVRGGGGTTSYNTSGEYISVVSSGGGGKN